jgi:hypothetical protein
LVARAPVLAEIMITDEEEETLKVVVLQEVDPHTFQTLLHFVYTDEMPSLEYLRRHGLSLLHAAYRFGCTWLNIMTQLSPGCGRPNLCSPQGSSD